MPVWLTIILAVLAPGGILVTLVQLKKENARDHAANSAKLDRVIEVSEDTRERLNDHIDYHLKHGR
jgi:low affinity Fe/Cu permease